MTPQNNDLVLNHIHEVSFDEIPLQWVTRFELFTLDLENFPLMYVHDIARVEDDLVRVFGFPFAVSSKPMGEFCRISIQFLCNMPEGIEQVDSVIRTELSHRFGIAKRVRYEDLAVICKGQNARTEMLQSLWSGRISSVYGDSIPHGRLYDKVFGMVRFAASGVSPLLGKTSELRMTYWFMKDIGQKVEYGEGVKNFGFFDFFLLPTADEIKSGQLTVFPNFASVFSSIQKFWDLEYTETFSLHDRSDLMSIDILDMLAVEGIFMK